MCEYVGMCAPKCAIHMATRQRDDMHDIQVVPDLQGREMREKVISNKETHKHPVINGPLRGEGGRERRRGRGEERGGEGGRGGELSRGEGTLYTGSRLVT